MKNIKFKKNGFWDVSDKYIEGNVETTLKRCPFCGEVAEMEFSVNKSSDYATVSIFCGECKFGNYRAKGENKKLYEIADELSEAWKREIGN